MKVSINPAIRKAEAEAFARSATESLWSQTVHKNFGWWICSIILEVRSDLKISRNLSSSKKEQYAFIYRFWRKASLEDLEQVRKLYATRQRELNARVEECR